MIEMEVYNFLTIQFEVSPGGEEILGNWPLCPQQRIK